MAHCWDIHHYQLKQASVNGEGGASQKPCRIFGENVSSVSSQLMIKFRVVAFFSSWNFAGLWIVHGCNTVSISAVWPLGEFLLQGRYGKLGSMCEFL